jgi:hypothetical protein
MKVTLAVPNSHANDKPQQKQQLTMCSHICNIVQQVRGRRPKPTSSFAMIGVDSLGAVMFIKYLSDSVGGVRIEPSKLYAPGVTIKSFAEDLHRRLAAENPSALERLGIAAECKCSSHSSLFSQLVRPLMWLNVLVLQMKIHLHQRQRAKWRREYLGQGSSLAHRMPKLSMPRDQVKRSQTMMMTTTGTMIRKSSMVRTK